MKDKKISLWSGVIGAVVTIIVAVGGSYVATQVSLARHDEILIRHSMEIKSMKQDQKEDRVILIRIDKNVAVMNAKQEDK